MVLRLIRALPGDHAWLPPSPADHPASLAPASERQNHTISPSAAMSLVVSTPPRPPHPTPRSVTIAIRPLSRRDAERKTRFGAKKKRIIFRVGTGRHLSN